MGGKVFRQVAWNWLLFFMVSWSKVWKFRFMTQRVIFVMRVGISVSVRNCRYTSFVRRWLFYSGVFRAYFGRSFGSVVVLFGFRVQRLQGLQSNEFGFKGRVLGYVGRVLGSCTFFSCWFYSEQGVGFYVGLYVYRVVRQFFFGIYL